MHVRLFAVGDRQPGWVDAAFDEYARRLPGQWQFRAETIATAQRGKKHTTEKARKVEGQKLVARLKPGDFVVALDEHGQQFSSRELGDKFESWQISGQDLVFLIGGPDGFDGDVLARANLRWSLSRLTLPHGLARIVMIEQIYRAWSLTTGHPYHRD